MDENREDGRPERAREKQGQIGQAIEDDSDQENLAERSFLSEHRHQRGADENPSGQGGLHPGVVRGVKLENLFHIDRDAHDGRAHQDQVVQCGDDHDDSHQRIGRDITHPAQHLPPRLRRRRSAWRRTGQVDPRDGEHRDEKCEGIEGEEMPQPDPGQEQGCQRRSQQDGQLPGGLNQGVGVGQVFRRRQIRQEGIPGGIEDGRKRFDQKGEQGQHQNADGIQRIEHGDAGHEQEPHGVRGNHDGFPGKAVRDGPAGQGKQQIGEKRCARDEAGEGLGSGQVETEPEQSDLINAVPRLGDDLAPENERDVPVDEELFDDPRHGRARSWESCYLPAVRRCE